MVDFDVKHGRVADYRYHLLPVFSELLPADPAMQANGYTSALKMLFP